ncbi:unnamed protein product [Ixodes persulcatus]
MRGKRRPGKWTGTPERRKSPWGRRRRLRRAALGMLDEKHTPFSYCIEPRKSRGVNLWPKEAVGLRLEREALLASEDQCPGVSRHRWKGTMTTRGETTHPPVVGQSSTSAKNHERGRPRVGDGRRSEAALTRLTRGTFRSTARDGNS